MQHKGLIQNCNKNIIVGDKMQKQQQHNNRFMALCPGLPGWAGTRRNTHPPTILIIIHSLSASSIYLDL